MSTTFRINNKPLVIAIGDETETGISLITRTGPPVPKLKTITAGDGVILQDQNDHIDISIDQDFIGVKSVNNTSTTGIDAKLVINTDPSEPLVRTLTAGENITLSQSTNTVDISAQVPSIDTSLSEPAYILVNAQLSSPRPYYGNKLLEIVTSNVVKWTLSASFQNLDTNQSAYTIKIPTLRTPVEYSLNAVGNSFTGLVPQMNCLVVDIGIEPGYIFVTMGTISGSNFISTVGFHHLNLAISFQEEE